MKDTLIHIAVYSILVAVKALSGIYTLFVLAVYFLCTMLSTAALLKGAYMESILILALSVISAWELHKLIAPRKNQYD